MKGYIVFVSKDFKTVGVYEDIVLELGLRFTWSGDERSVTRTLKAEHPLLIILDLELDDNPSWGLSFCRKVKSNEEFSSIPVLIRSKIVDEEIYETVVSSGAVGILPADYPPEKIQKTIKNLSLVISESKDSASKQVIKLNEVVESELKDVALSEEIFESSEEIDPDAYSEFVNNLTSNVYEDPKDLLDDTIIDYGEEDSRIREILATVLYNIRESGHLDDKDVDIYELVLSYTNAVINDYKK